jgi:hypothetical protein
VDIDIEQRRDGNEITKQPKQINWTVDIFWNMETKLWLILSNKGNFCFYLNRGRNFGTKFKQIVCFDFGNEEMFLAL